MNGAEWGQAIAAAVAAIGGAVGTWLGVRRKRRLRKGEQPSSWRPRMHGRVYFSMRSHKPSKTSEPEPDVMPRRRDGDGDNGGDKP